MACVRCGKPTYKNSDFCSECKKNNYMRNYLKGYRKKKKRHDECLECGSKKNVMPFRGLCKKCYNSFVDSQRRKDDGG